MKTSGVSCETKFGLLGFLGHPTVQEENIRNAVTLSVYLEFQFIHFLNIVNSALLCIQCISHRAPPLRTWMENRYGGDSWKTLTQAGWQTRERLGGAVAEEYKQESLRQQSRIF